MDEPLQLRFRLAPEDAELLGDAALERRLAEHDRQSERLHAAVQRLVPRALSVLLMAAPVLAIGLLYAFEPRPVRAEFWVSSAVAIVLSGLVLWFFRARLVERIAALGSRRRARVQPAMRDRVARALHRSVTRSATRAVGIHEVTISAQGRRDRHADARREDVAVGGVALVFVDQDEAARVGEPLDAAHRGDPGERRQQHRERVRQFARLHQRAPLVQLVQLHVAGLDRRDTGVGDPADVALAQRRFHQSPGIAHPAQAHVAHVGLGRDVGDRHAVAQLAAAQVGVDDHRELVGRTEAARAGRGADQHRTRPFQQRLVGLPGFLGMRAGADRMRVAAFRPQARHVVEGQPRTGGDHQVVVVQHLAVGEVQAVLRRQHALRRDRNEADAVAAHRRLHLHPDRLRLAPAHRDPGIGRRELEIRAVADQRHRMRRPQRRLDLVRGRRTAQPGPQNDDVCHDAPPPSFADCGIDGRACGTLRCRPVASTKHISKLDLA